LNYLKTFFNNRKWLFGFIILLVLVFFYVFFINKTIYKNKPGQVLGTGDFTNQIIGITNTQAVLTYSSPTTSPCSILVSESASYSPLVNDVNPTLFSDSDKDNRPGSSSSGSEKVFVIGKRSADLALDGIRYSRALQAYTTHYYKIICGNLEGTGSFTTKNIPTGNTYSDTIPGDTNGSSTWPTILNDRSQIIIDPQTGLKITRASLISDSTTSTGTYPSNLNFGASASVDSCSNNLVADYNGNMGYHCIADSALFWINPTTGEARPVGVPASLYDGVNFGSFVVCNKIDPNDGNFFYCIRNSISGKTVIIKLEYKGQNTFLNRELPICTGSNEPCVESTILTPETGNNDLISLIKNFEPEYTDNFNSEGYSPFIAAVQNGKLIIEQFKSIQDSYAWYFVFNPGNGIPVGQASSTAGVIAAMSTYKHYPIRWCSSHGIIPIGNVDWVFTGSNYLRGGSYAGLGIYTTNIVGGNLPNTTYTCPTNSFGDSLCTDITVDGEPCDENENPQIFSAKCGNASHSYLQDAEVGDIFGIEPNPSRARFYKEFIRLIAKSGNNWTVARGINQTPIVSHATGVIDAACTAHDTQQSNYDLGNWAWDFINDPHGTGTLGSTIVYDRNGTGGHGAYRPNKMIEIYGSSQYQIRSGIFPNFVDATKTLIDDGNPAFAGVQGIGSPNTVDSHPSFFYNDEFVLDGRPMNSGGIDYSASAISLGSGVYKYPTGAISLNRKKLATIAYSGTYILTDISGTNSNINSASDHSYCVVVNSGECNSGSQSGEVYVKSTTATITTCPYPGVSLTGWDQKHICIGDNSAYNQAISQIGPTVRPNGKNGRMLTHGLTSYNRQDVYWNLRATLDGTGMLFTLPYTSFYGEGSGQLFYAKLPPFTTDSTIRDDFMDIPVDIASNPEATSASVLFGYAENGSSENFYCTSRKEACIKGNQSNKNYNFVSEGYTPVSCSSGCTINIPGIPSRVTYLKVQYHNASGTVISTLNTQVVAAEPTFNLSPASNSLFTISNITTSNLANTTATINWTTSTSTDSQVLYGLTSSYASSTAISNTSTKVTSHSVNLTGLTKNTTYVFVVKSVDASGNQVTSSEQTFTTTNNSQSVDNSPPTVSITSPTNSSTVSGTITITADAFDNAGDVAVQFKINGNTNLGSEDNTSPYSVVWDTTQVNNTNHTLSATARDTSGNVTTSTTITINVNNLTSGGGGGSVGTNFLNPTQSNLITSLLFPIKPELQLNSNRNRCLIKFDSDFKVSIEGKLYSTNNQSILRAYGFETKDAIQPTADDYKTKIEGELLPPDGTLIKLRGEATIYMVQSGKKRPFISLSIFRNFGYLTSSVITLNKNEFNQLPIGEPISSAETRHPRGINVKDSKTIYWMGQEKRYPYPSLEVYNSWNIDNNFNKVVPANIFDLQVPITNELKKPNACN
jgi:hypothetical protein